MTNRCVDIIVGLAAGSEGKGKLVSMLAQDIPYSALVRTGGPNAAHTIYYNDEAVAFHQIPCGSLHAPNAKLVLGANAQIDLDHLKHEIDILKKHNCFYDSIGEPRLLIDPQATIIETIDKVSENGGRMPGCGELYFNPTECEIHNNSYTGKYSSSVFGTMFSKEAGTCLGCPELPKDSMWADIGSTTHGAGANLIRKMMRGSKPAVLLGQRLDIKKLISDELVNGLTYDEVIEKVVESLDRWYEAVDPEPVKLAKDEEFLKPYIYSTVDYLNELVDIDEPIMLEGTQGAMLSLHHAYWPKCTSRDTNAGNWVTEAGLSPLTVRDIYGVTRTFPIRVAGKSGPLSGTEISWDEVTEHATKKPYIKWNNRLEQLMQKYNAQKGEDPVKDSELLEEMNDLKENIASVQKIVEKTTATKRERRVFTFCEDDFSKAVAINRPTKLAINFVDYLNLDDAEKTSWDSLSQGTKDWITTLESKLGVFFNILSTGPKPEHIIIRKSPGELVVQVQGG